MESKKYALNWKDMESLLVTGLILSGSTIITYLIQVIPSVDFGKDSVMVVTVLTFILKILQKYISGK